MRLHVKVKPNSGKQEVIKISDIEYQVNLKSSPEDNKANIELLKFLKKHFKKQPKIITGKTSKNKIVDLREVVSKKP